MRNSAEMLPVLLALCSIASVVRTEVMIFTESVELAKLNPDYIDIEESFSSVEEDSDSSTVSMKVTFTREVPCSAIIFFELLQYGGGEYTIPVGITFEQPLGQFMGDSSLIGPILRAMKMTTCPVKPGEYKMENFKIQTDALDYICNGQYLAHTELRLPDKTLLMDVNGYVGLDKV